MPGSDIPSAEWLELIHADKLVHMGMYGGLVFWLLHARSRQLKKPIKKLHEAWGFILFGVLYGIAMELVQLFFTSDRQFDVYDMLANSCGAILGWLIFRWIGKWFVRSLA